jgi:UDP-2,3-diacylglucosamine pyrophosphatase LpxH
MKKRPVDLVVLSDIHLGTYGCHARELYRYMKSIRPEVVILNGDIIDMWQFSKKYWPKAHMKVIKVVVDWISSGITVYYVAGNHDEMLRKFVGFNLSGFSIVNKVVLDLDGKTMWAFHGDVFDVTMKHSKWLARMGAVGYDALILLNRGVNFFSKKLGYGPISMSRKIKNGVKSAVKFIDNFEETALEIARDNDYDYVVCGHIHQPEIRETTGSGKKVTYLNSGDWIENLTSLEYHQKKWRLYHYLEDRDMEREPHFAEEGEEVLDTHVLFDHFLKEMRITKSGKL